MLLCYSPQCGICPSTPEQIKNTSGKVHNEIVLTSKKWNCQIYRKIDRTWKTPFLNTFYLFLENLIFAYNLFWPYPPSNSSQTFTTTPLYCLISLFLTHWVLLVLLPYGRVYVRPFTGAWSDHTAQENWFSLRKQPSVINNSSAVGWGLWAPGSVLDFSLARSWADNQSSRSWVQVLLCSEDIACQHDLTKHLTLV